MPILTLNHTSQYWLYQNYLWDFLDVFFKWPLSQGFWFSVFIVIAVVDVGVIFELIGDFSI